MNRSDAFVLLVQSAFFLMKEPPPHAIDVIGDALAVPEVALPDDIATGAKEWVRWKLFADSFPKPDWLKEFEENIASVVIMEQCEGTPEWWANAEQVIDGATVPSSWIAFVTGRNRMVKMSKIEAKEFLEWAREIRGWSEEEPSARIHS